MHFHIWISELFRGSVSPTYVCTLCINDLSLILYSDVFKDKMAQTVYIQYHLDKNATTSDNPDRARARVLN